MSVFRRCGCVTPDGKQFAPLFDKATADQRATTCPILLTDSRHGSWGFAVSAGSDPGTGKRLRVRRMGFATKKEAQQAQATAVTEASTGKVRAPQKTTFGTFIGEWIERARGRDGKPLKGSTLANYRRYVDQDITPALGALRLADVRRHHVQAFIDRLGREGRGTTTIRRIHAVLSGALASAVKRDLIADNPAHGVELPATHPPKVQPWPIENVATFIEVAYGHRLGVLFETVLLTGLRRGEALALRWSDIDFLTSTITVRANRTMAGTKVVENAAKTDAGRRQVSMPPRLVDSLIAWKTVQELEASEWGDAYRGENYVFTYENGLPLLPQYATRLFEKLRVQAGLPKATFHGQRHEAAALMIAGGTDLLTVSKILGHSSVGITGDTYGHVFEAGKAKAAEAAAALLPPRVIHIPDTSEAIEG